MAFLEWWSNGLTNASWLTIVLFTLAVTHVTIAAVTLYLHRHSAHRSLELHPAVQHFFRFWLWMTTGMVTKEWTAVHRKHHSSCDVEGDPHSPVVYGIKEIFWKGAEYYKESGADQALLDQYGKGTPDDWVERNVYTRYGIGGVGAMLIIDCALFGVIGLTVWAIQMLWIPVLAAGVINGIGHYKGYRNFECPDAARNVSPWGILIGGEELHNNHHTYPNSAKLSVKRWEFDIGWMYIRILQAFRLAKPLSVGPVVARVPGKSDLDMDTAWAVLNDRFRVMARYAEGVVAPLVEQEYHRADEATRNLYKRAKKILCREEMLVDEAGRDRINEITEVNPRLKTIYEMRLKLMDVWAKRGGSGEDLLGSLRAWCAEAEKSGINSLQEFVEELKSYTIPTLAKA